MSLIGLKKMKQQDPAQRLGCKDDGGVASGYMEDDRDIRSVGRRTLLVILRESRSHVRGKRTHTW